MLFGSATPSVQDYYRFTNSRPPRQQPVLLTQRYRNLADATITIVPNHASSNQRLDSQMMALIQETISRQQQVLIFINQRGYAPRLFCRACNATHSCHDCAHAMVIHRATNRVHCHLCGATALVPTRCQSCNSADLIPSGAGTQRVELQLEEAFGADRVLRIDRDLIKGSFTKAHHKIAAGEVSIVVGTQLMIKGHNFPSIATAIYLNADQALKSYEHTATETLATQLVQLAGRTTRYHQDKQEARVIVPTAYPDHPLFATLAKKGYLAWATTELATRKECALPPFSKLALITLIAKPTASLAKNIEQITYAITALNNPAINAPVPAPIPKIAGKWRYHILIRTSKSQDFDYTVDTAVALMRTHTPSAIAWHLDVDPFSMDGPLGDAPLE